MNTYQINHILSTNPVTKNFFNGVFPIDFLKNITEKPQMIICNTDKSYEPGEHWVIFFFNSENVDFFDSLGKNPSEYGTEFIKFMQKFVDQCNFSSKRIQPVNTNLCGHYCVYFAHKRCQGYDMHYILNNLPDYHVIKRFSESYLRKFDDYYHENSQCCNKN